MMMRVNRYRVSGVRCRGARGKRFTLLEIIAVVSIAGVLMAGLLIALRGTILMRERDDAATRDDAARQHCLDVVSRDLRGIVPPGTPLSPDFLGEPEEADDVRRDTVEFATSANSPRDGVFGGDVIRVSYSIVQDEQDVPGHLVRSVWRNQLSVEEEDPEEQVLIDGIHSLAFTYYDGEEWLDSWDSSLTENVLPQAVTARIERVADLDAEFGEVIELTVPIFAVTPPLDTESQEGAR